MYQLVLQTSYVVSSSSSKGNSRHLSPRVGGEGGGGRGEGGGVGGGGGGGGVGGGGGDGGERSRRGLCYYEPNDVCIVSGAFQVL